MNFLKEIFERPRLDPLRPNSNVIRMRVLLEKHNRPGFWGRLRRAIKGRQTIGLADQQDHHT